MVTKTMAYIYSKEYYTAIKNEIMAFSGAWMKLEEIMLSEGTQSPPKKQRPYIFSNRCMKIHSRD